jgi:hypothetical protein
MGIEFLVEADIPGQGIFHRKPGRDRLFSAICNVIREYINDPLMARMVQIDKNDEVLAVTLHPCAEPIEFTWKSKHTLQASTKTSTVGPGYHAHVIEILRHVGATLDLSWNWETEDADGTGFAQTGDFAALQSEMAQLWQFMAKIPLERHAQGNQRHMLNMPIGFPFVQIDALAITPLGPLSTECCQAVQSGDQEVLIEACRRYYVWWNQEPDAAFWRNTGLALMWCEVPWHVPIGDSAVSLLALDCMKRAIELDRNIDVPQEEMNELAALMAPNASSQPPRDEGIGYRRREMSFALTGSWSFSLPGYYYQTEEDDGASVVFYFGDRTIRFSSFTVTSDSEAHPSRKEMLLSRDSANARGEEIINLDDGPIQGWASIAAKTEDGEAFWMLQGEAACENSLGIITICYVDPADKVWAVKTFRGIMYAQADH